MAELSEQKEPVVKPRFEAHKLEGKAFRRICTPKTKKHPTTGKVMLDKDDIPILAGGFEYEDLEVDAGWMVYLPNGSSVHIWTKEEMERQGFDLEPTLVNMETGDTVSRVEVGNLKKRSEQMSATKRNVHHT